MYILAFVCEKRFRPFLSASKSAQNFRQVIWNVRRTHKSVPGVTIVTKESVETLEEGFVLYSDAGERCFGAIN